MKVKRYEGRSEIALRQRIHDELGPDAIVLNIKTKPYTGLLGVFLKPLVIVTAAFEEPNPLDVTFNNDPAKEGQQALQNMLYGKAPSKDKPSKDKEETEPAVFDDEAAVDANTQKLIKNLQTGDQQQKIASLENKLTMTEELLAKVVTQLNVAEQIAKDGGTIKRRYGHNMIQMFYELLLDQGVTSDITETLLGELDIIEDQEKIDITLIVKIVYNNIVGILSGPRLIETKKAEEGERQIAFFMGSTGVGKTTTIAKLSSVFTLAHNMRIGLITADTYRIAAIEQLKTYADILNLDVKVVYTNDEIIEYLNKMLPKKDAVLVDTAGRSHRNETNMKELSDLLVQVPDSKRYLVLSLATRDRDLIEIVNTYSKITDFDLIFTKLDETTTLGSILNICYATGKKVAYLTFGQNVPDDLEALKPDKIAKSILGINEGTQPYAQETM
jgi:flagellar biosynthesis protein FlhF